MNGSCSECGAPTVVVNGTDGSVCTNPECGVRFRQGVIYT